MNFQANVFIDLIGLLVLAGIALNERGKATRLLNERLFRCLLICVAHVLTFDMFAWAFDGASFPGARVLLMALNTFYYAFQPLFCFFWLMYADYRSMNSPGRLKRLAPLYAVPLIAEWALILINVRTGWIFVLSDQNVYARGAYYLSNLIPYYLYILGSIVITVFGLFVRRGEARGRVNALFIVIMLVPVVGTFLVTQAYGVSCGWPLVAASLLMVYLEAQSRKLLEQQVEAATLQAELAQSRISIMLSQIQPHFLYNALNSIKALCDRKDDRAGEAVADFAKFLRGNLDSLNAREPIPMSREIDHVKKYLTIETLRFPDVKVIFDIKRSDFLIPALTVQPLVENAISHGLSGRGGGTVTVSAWEEDGVFCVRVADDGKGFDPEKPPGDGRNHIGIANTRERLKIMCGGEMEIESRIGTGTSVTVKIPGGAKMNAICVDDEQLALDTLKTELAKTPRVRLSAQFLDHEAALEFMGRNRVDLAFLDINLRGGVSGLNVARRIREISPNTRVIFTTGYSEYALEAMRMHAAGYLMKPVTAEDIDRELDALAANPAPPVGASPLRVQCFGNFEVFSGGKPLQFKRQRSRELFAYLVDRRGATATVGELCAALWPGKPGDVSQRTQLRALVADLRRTLRECGADRAVIKTWGGISVVPEALECDYYRLLRGDVQAVNAYRGEYMAQYDWAELTLGRLGETKQ